MRRDAAHGVHRHRPADYLVVGPAVHVGPADRQLDGLVERDLRHFQRDAVDRLAATPHSAATAPARNGRRDKRSLTSENTVLARRPSGRSTVASNAGAMSGR